MWVGVRDVGGGACCCQNVCLHRPCPLPPRAACPPAAVISWLSSGKEMAKQGTVYLCRLYSLHIPAAGQRHHSNLPGFAKKTGPLTVCTEVPGWRSILSTLWQPRAPSPPQPPQSCRTIGTLGYPFNLPLSRGILRLFCYCFYLMSNILFWL